MSTSAWLIDQVCDNKYWKQILSVEALNHCISVLNGTIEYVTVNPTRGDQR